MKKKILSSLILVCSLNVMFAAPVWALNYTREKNWLHKPQELVQPVDVFYLPTAGTTKPEAVAKSIKPYSTVGDIYVPAYKKPKDAKKALTTYLQQADNQRPFILAADPQSADLAVKLYQELSPNLQKKVIAAYVPGAKALHFKPKEKDSAPQGSTHAMRKRLEALRQKEEKHKTKISKKPVSKIITHLPTRNFEKQLLSKTENFLENDKPYYSMLSKTYARQAHAFVEEIKKDLPLTDYGLKLRKPRDTRLYTRDIVIHHSGTPRDMDLSARAIQNMHLHNGWHGIGYHFVIRKNGTVEIGTPLETIGAHSYQHNANTIGIHLSGNFELARPTKAQLTSLEKLIAHLAKDYRLNLNQNLIWGHRHYNHDTACPGIYLNNLLPEIRQKARAYASKL